MDATARGDDAVRGRGDPERWIGEPLRRREDRRFLRGEARYVDDLPDAGDLHMVVVRSPVAHGRLRGIETERARRAPGVAAVFTEEDLGGRLKPIPFNVVEGGETADVPHPVLASGRVRYVGQPVAVVLAEDRARAEDAADLVDVDLQQLPALTDPADALGGEPRLHERLRDNVLLRWSRTGGDVDAAFASAARVVRSRFRIPRLAAAPLEPRGALATHDPQTDLLTVWASSQDPYRPIGQLSTVLGRPRERIRFVVPDVGGAFGSKGGLYPEVALASWVAIELGRPVRWVENRSENFVAAYQGRGIDADVELAVGPDHAFLGIRASVVADLGAYLYPATALVPVTTSMLLTGVYVIAAAHVELVGVATNKVPTGPYRGAGRPEATFIIERMVDLAAAEIGTDPVELRRRNVIPRDRFPYATPLGFTYDSGDYGRLLDRVVALAGYDALRREQATARRQGRLLGAGIALFVERAGAQLWEQAALAVGADGRVTVRTGSTAHGQGHETVFAQIAADALGVNPDDVTVEQGDTARLAEGVGTFSSRSTAVGGSAVVRAAEELKTRARTLASHLLGAPQDEVEWDRGVLRVRGEPTRTVSLGEVAAAAGNPESPPRGSDATLVASARFSLPGPIFPSGAYVASVEVDPDTGMVTILRIVAVDDAGRIVNPLLAEGQVVGSTAQGVASAVTEHVLFDDQGRPLTASFVDYGIQGATEIPPVTSEFIETHSPHNPLGAKGIGESGSIGAPAAVVNAVVDALKPYGIRHLDPPLTAERVWRAMSR